MKVKELKKLLEKAQDNWKVYLADPNFGGAMEEAMFSFPNDVLGEKGYVLVEIPCVEAVD